MDYQTLTGRMVQAAFAFEQQNQHSALSKLPRLSSRYNQRYLGPPSKAQSGREDTIIMKLNPSNTSFGRHETFFLRYSWLTKGFWAFKEFADKSKGNGTLFNQDDAVVTLGVGKNMVSSIKYWLIASRMLEEQGAKLIASDLGDDLLGSWLTSSTGWDPYLEDEATLWLLHWLIASNANKATSFFWFFNCYHKTQFSAEELRTALSDFVKEHIGKTSAATLKNDVAVITRMYSAKDLDKKNQLDDALDSPMALLGLLEDAGSKQFKSTPAARLTLPATIVGFALAQIFNSRQQKAIPIEDLVYSKDNQAAIGSVFRLTENNTIALIEKAVELQPNVFDIRETAGLHQVFKVTEAENIDEMHYLKLHYDGAGE